MTKQTEARVRQVFEINLKGPGSQTKSVLIGVNPVDGPHGMLRQIADVLEAWGAFSNKGGIVTDLVGYEVVSIVAHPSEALVYLP